MERKLIKIGGRSLGVIIPSEWTRRHGLTAGSQVRLLAENDMLIISLVDRPKERVKVSGDDVEKLTRDIIAYYVEGVDELEVDTRHFSTVVTRIESKLPGVVAMDTGGVLKLKIVTKRDIDVEEVINSMYTTVDVMFTLFLKLLRESDREIAAEILRLDDQLDRLYFLALRTVKKSFASYIYTITAKNLEHVGDAIDRATSYYLQTESRCGEILDIFNKVYQYLQVAFAAFRTGDQRQALRALIERPRLEREVLKIQCPQATGFAHEAASIVGFAADIAEAAYSKTIK